MEKTNQDRLLIVKEMLYNDTDLDTSLSIQDIIDELRKEFKKMKLDPRTIRTDLETLNHNGFKVTQKKGKFGKLLYSHEHRLFETHELSLLIDSVQTSNIIPNEMKQHLIFKLSQLAGNDIGSALLEYRTYKEKGSFRNKWTRNIERVYRALGHQKCIQFKLGNVELFEGYPVQKNQTLYMHPYALIWRQGYYLVGKLKGFDDVVHCRLEELTDIRLSTKAYEVVESFDISEYIDHNFTMYSGEEFDCEIRFENLFISHIADLYGTEKIRMYNDDYFILNLKKKLTWDFVDWILTFGNWAKVVSPPELVDLIKVKIDSIQTLYDEKD